ncbi:MAG TPA: peptidoglycan DD-metalloendopeptidase family protein [Alphaproteobacteria bacterium]|nr:peptidoglycan DD-metalloendopeptidase family protein [Alphaproteobacteria bacterium]
MDLGHGVRVWNRIRRAFRRRELYLREEHGLRYIAIPPARQALAAVLGAAVLLLSVSGLTGTALYWEAAVNREQALVVARAEHWRLLQNLDGLAERLDAGGIEAVAAPGALMHDMLRRERESFNVLLPGPEPGELGAVISEPMPNSIVDGLLLAEAHARLLQRTHKAEQESERLLARERELSDDIASLRVLLADSDSERLEQGNTIGALSRRIGELEAELTAAEDRTERIGADLMVAQFELEDESERYQIAEADRLALRVKADQLEGEVAFYRNTQASWLLALGAHTQDSIALVENAVAMTGINVENLLARAQKELRSAAGGPFMVAISETAALSDGVGAIATDVGVQVERWEALKLLVRAMPLSAPLDQYQISSGFGRRTDPFNGRKAMHTGIDFKAPVKTAVLSTAPGRVVFAGRNREYGRLVEIDHGFGIRTRYAHLAEIAVKQGDEVANRAKIGLLGSSGRSTGPHLHYEVLIDGRPMNPIKFLEAARHVLKG